MENWRTGTGKASLAILDSIEAVRSSIEGTGSDIVPTLPEFPDMHS